MTKQPVLSKPSENADCSYRSLDIFNSWTTTVSPRDFTSGHPTHGKHRSGSDRTIWKNVNQRDLKKLGTEWSVEEAEVADQDQLHEADW